MGTTPEAAAQGTDVERLRALIVRLLRMRKTFIRIASAVCAGVVVFSLLIPRQYEARTALAVEGDANQAAGLAGIAADFGVSLGTSGAQANPDFYAELLRSEGFARRLLLDSFPTSDDGMTQLASYFQATDSADRFTVEAALKALERSLLVSVSPRTGTIGVRFVARDRILAAGVITRMTEYLFQHDVSARQRRARVEREFIEGRVKDASAALDETEAELVAFLRANRQYVGSPLLVVEYERLQRRVALRQQVQLDLARSLEQAKIDEVRSTPLLAIVEPVVAPVMPKPRRLAMKLLLALSFLFCVTVVGNLFVGVGTEEYVGSQGSVAALREELRDVVEDLKILVRWRARGERS